MTQTTCKQWTLSEAKRALVLVARIVDQLMDQYRQVMAVRREIDSLPVDSAFSAETELIAQHDKHVKEVGELLNELHKLEVILVCFNEGVVHFPTTMESKPAVWCWRFGESKVTRWHEVSCCKGAGI